MNVKPWDVVRFMELLRQRLTYGYLAVQAAEDPDNPPAELVARHLEALVRELRQAIPHMRKYRPLDQVVLWAAVRQLEQAGDVVVDFGSFGQSLAGALSGELSERPQHAFTL